jgi:mannose-6-phosphate isomerase-like protein (cupin superfamily)
MSDYRVLPPYENLNPGVPRPVDPLPPSFLTLQDGVPVIYSADTAPTCGVRIVHPSNPKAPSSRLGISVLFVPPMARMDLHEHEAEEIYIIQAGSGEMLYRDGSREVSVGDFVYLPSWTPHGIVNTGREGLTVLLALTPPNP